MNSLGRRQLHRQHHLPGYRCLQRKTWWLILQLMAHALPEDESYVLTFDNLTAEDTVEINVNGVKYSLRVGVDLDGNEIAGEELTTQGGNAGSQEAIQAAFLTCGWKGSSTPSWMMTPLLASMPKQQPRR